MKKPLIVGNWKMYIEKPQDAKKFAAGLRRKARAFSGVDVIIAPALPLIPVVAGALAGSAVRTGAQTVSPRADGPYTGEVSASMISAAGASAAIIGHSERRAAGETDEAIAAQTVQANRAGLVTILCVGERERDPAGAYLAEVAAQLSSALQNVPKSGTGKLVIAYEPVWAIGKSSAEAMGPADLREMVIFIRKTLADIFDRAPALRVPILYGGSVDETNAGRLFAEGGVGGFLVGRASTELTSFVEIVRVCQ